MAWGACCTTRTDLNTRSQPKNQPGQSSTWDCLQSRPRDEDESRKYEVDELSAWITEEESFKIIELRRGLSEEERQQLDSEPEDIRHDLMLCRFLRGHGGKVAAALKAVRAHLVFRREFSTIIRRARLHFPEGEQHYRAERTLFAKELNSKFVQLQLPPHAGTNDGMPVSLLVVRLFNMDAFSTLPEQQLREWFISCLEQRSFTLHNQSIKEQRVARVLEARDCMGFSFSQLIASPRLLWKVKRVFQDGRMYPELLGRLFFFNLTPGSRAVSLLRSLIDEELRKKVIFTDRGDWKSTLCMPNTLSPSVLPHWAYHVANHEWKDGWQGLSSNCPMAVSAVSIARGQTSKWFVFCESSETKSQPAILRITSFYVEKSNQPSFVSFCAPRELRVYQKRVSCNQSFTAPAAGVVLVQVDLKGQAVADVSIKWDTSADGDPACAPSERPKRRGTFQASRSGKLPWNTKLCAMLMILVLAWFTVHCSSWRDR